jgi:hypothetical protein
MSGRRDSNFRSGDQAEYRVGHGLSLFSFVVPTPRQEDFGVADFACVLTSQEDRHLVLPRGAFYVQVKANAEKITFDEYQIRWMTHNMDLPLFVCVAPRTSQSMEIYSCSKLWDALFLRTEPESVTVRLVPSRTPRPWHTETDGLQHQRFDIYIGPPILKRPIADLMRDASTAYEVMRFWVDFDAANIARRRIGRLASQTVEGWKTNIAPTDYVVRTQFAVTPNYPDAERALAPILSGLALCYGRFHEKEKLAALNNYLQTLGVSLHDRPGDSVHEDTSD